jgi:LPS sulfotransferase NodH
MRWGFKEIRYNNLATMRLLREMYPQGRFIFVRRDALEVTRSKVFAFVKESRWADFSPVERERKIRQMLEEVQAHYRVYEQFVKRNPDISLVVDYERLVAEPRAVTVRMLEHAHLDQNHYDWELAGKVMDNVITRTRRDDEVIRMIQDVAAGMAAGS